MKFGLAFYHYWSQGCNGNLCVWIIDKNIHQQNTILWIENFTIWPYFVLLCYLVIFPADNGISVSWKLIYGFMEVYHGWHSKTRENLYKSKVPIQGQVQMRKNENLNSEGLLCELSPILLITCVIFALIWDY